MGRRWRSVATEELRARAPFVLSVVVPALIAAVYLDLFNYYLVRKLIRPGLIFELGLLLHFSLVVALVQRRRLLGAALATLVLLAFYSVSFGVYLILHEPPSVFDAELLGELLYVMPAWCVTVLVGASATTGVMFLRNVRRPSVWAYVSLAPYASYIVCALLFPGTVIAVLDTVRPRFTTRTDLDLIRAGPLFSLARDAAVALHRRRFFEPAEEATLSDALALPSLDPAQKRNVHVIVMESFIDPLNFSAVHFPFDPMDPRLRRWMNEGPAVALSPTFGGKTAQAEFEILCGVPAYGVFGVEFNQLGGARLPCLPQILQQLGYSTVGSVAVPPSFFNCGRAYAAAGLQRAYFAADFPFRDRDGEWVSNAEVLSKVSQFIEPDLAQPTPLFNYVVTTSGHAPFRMNPRKRPPVFDGDSVIHRVANGVYYNSAAVADFVATLEERDPQAVIVIVGDHLPPLGLDDAGYRDGDYHLHGGSAPQRPGFWEPSRLSELERWGTPLIVRNRGRSVPLGVVPHFAIPEIILDLLSDGTFCAQHPCVTRMPIVYRPEGGQPRFTTAATFPEAVCGAGQRNGNVDCGAAERQHQVWFETYRSYLQRGGQPLR